MAVIWQAEGVLQWSRDERIGDRYGAVMLFIAPGSDFQVGFSDAPVGVRARMEVEVLEARQPAHIGDLFRGFFPPEGGAEVGKRLVLGEGTVFVDTFDAGNAIGVRPDDGRTVDWLDPGALYEVHEQTVRLKLIAE